MEKKITNKDFFKGKMGTDAAPRAPEKADAPRASKQAEAPAQASTPKAPAHTPAGQAKAPAARAEAPRKKKPVKVKSEAVHIQAGPELAKTLKALGSALDPAQQKQLAAVLRDAKRDHFTVAVVGEFSKGKSTLINHLVGKDFLPVGNMPTTALLTRIQHRETEVLAVYDKQGRRTRTLPLSQQSWDGLTAENFGGKEPEGTVLAAVNSPWLGKNGIELMDTPGAGDLEERRAQIIGDALLGADGAIITISATAALSMSERSFIQQRLLARKTPYLMLAVTKLDQVPLEQRTEVVDYIVNRLSLWKMDIPVFLPYDVEMPTDKYQNVMGVERMRGQLAAWQRDPSRIQLTQQWLAARAISIADTAISGLREQLTLLEADGQKREELVAKKKQQLSNASVVWEDLRLKLLERCCACEGLLREKTQASQISVTDRLQYEASHAGNPQRWWTEDYPYRLKVELANMSGNIENLISRRIAEDAKWFNTALEQQFKTHVLFEKEGAIADREMFDSLSAGGKGPEFENINRQRTALRIGTTVLTIAGYAVCMQLGALPLIATMGIGTGSALVSERVFKGKVEQQQAAIKDAIRHNVPELMEAATAESAKRIQAMYNSILEAAVEKERVWMEAQREAIQAGAQPKDPDQEKRVQDQITRLDGLRTTLYLM